MYFVGGIKKGESNMTSVIFCEFVDNDILLSHHFTPNLPCSISFRTFVRLLHQLGFSHKKGLYIDEHEREDVAKNYKVYLAIVKQLTDTHQPPPPCGDELPPDPISSFFSPHLISSINDLTIRSSVSQFFMMSPLLTQMGAKLCHGGQKIHLPSCPK